MGTVFFTFFTFAVYKTSTTTNSHICSSTGRNAFRSGADTKERIPFLCALEMRRYDPSANRPRPQAPPSSRDGIV